MLTQQIDIVQIAQQPEWKEMIMDIVNKEQMNPWDINISQITVGFLDQIKNKQKLNLKLSANVMLAASILLRYKSDSFNLHQRQDNELAGAVFIPDQVYVQDVIPELEPTMRATKRKVTLDELISAVEDIISKEKEKATRQHIKIEHVVPQSLLDMITDNPEAFQKELKRTFEKIKKDANGENLSMFSNIIETKTSEGVITALIPVLHLANSGYIAVWQEEIFGEILINLLTEKYEAK